MLPVVVVDFDSNASYDEQQAILAACNRTLQTTECVAGSEEAERPTRAIAQVSWASDDKAHLELGIQSLDRWITHEIVFTQDEPPAERWRAIGFSIATLVGEEKEDDGVDTADQSHTRGPVRNEAVAPSVGLRLAPRIGVGLDRPTVLGGVEVQVWASPFETWTPIAGFGYSVPLRPPVDVHWSELELGIGAGLRRVVGPTELRLALLFTATHIAVSNDADTLSVWVPGGQVSAEVRWPTHQFWTIATRVSGQLNAGATGIAQQGQVLASSPGWLFGASSGLEIQF